jgi:hypothetical protein
VAPLHALTSAKQVFQWGGKQQKTFETLKEKISIISFLALPNLQHPFEIQIDVLTIKIATMNSAHKGLLKRYYLI